MKTNVASRECWIVGQIAGIRMLERELADAFRSPAAGAREDLRRRVAELNCWLNALDHALSDFSQSRLPAA